MEDACSSCQVTAFLVCRSSWCRYINHAGSDEAACNVDSLVNRQAALVWFVARRDIAAGAELCFDYQ